MIEALAPVRNFSYLTGGVFAHAMLSDAIAEASIRRDFKQNPMLSVVQRHDLPINIVARGKFLDGFSSYLAANSGLRHADNVTWTFTVNGGYDAPSEFRGEATALPREFAPPPKLLPVIFETAPSATFSMSLHFVEPRKPQAEEAAAER